MAGLWAAKQVGVEAFQLGLPSLDDAEVAPDVAGHGEVAVGIVHLDVALAPGPWREAPPDDDVEAGTRGADLGVARQLRDDAGRLRGEPAVA